MACETKLYVHKITAAIIKQLQAKDTQFGRKEADLDRALRLKTQMSRRLEDAQMKLADMQRENEEKLQIWTVKAD